MKHPPYNLKGSSLEVFSALYSLTRKRAFLGTYEDLASWIEIDIDTLRRAIKRLIERGLVSAERAEGSLYRYEFKAHQIKGYPLPDYKYSGKRSYTDAPIIDSQNIDEYSRELEQTQNASAETQNALAQTQNAQISKEKNQKKNNYNIYTNTLKREGEEGQKPSAATAHNNNFEEDIIPTPKTLQEVWEYAQQKQPGISLEVVRDFFVYYSAKGWRYKSNGLVRNWKAELFLWDQRSKRWEKEKATRAFTRYQQGGRQEEPSLAQIMAERAIAQQKEADRRLAEEHDKLANTPEALAARDRVLAKFCK